MRVRVLVAVAFVLAIVALILFLTGAQAIQYDTDIDNDGDTDAVDIGIVRAGFNSHNFPSATPTSTSTPTITPTPTFSPTPNPSSTSFVYGVNLGLYDAQDQFLTSALTRQRMVEIGVTQVRLPIRKEGCAAAHEIAAVQRVVELGLSPMVILKYSQPNPLAAAQCVVNQVNAVAPGVVYYEFGNERDLAGVTATQYRAQWNATIPALKAMAPDDQFGGPVTAWPNVSYIGTFYSGANPTPDFVSYHNYACGNSDDAAECIDNITEADGDDWSDNYDHVHAVVGNTPIFVTEWSYDPVPPSGDPRPTPAFWDAFIRAALAEWATNGVAGATYYVLSDSIYELVDDSGNLTAAGQAFKEMTP